MKAATILLNIPMGKINPDFSGTVSGNEISEKIAAGTFSTSPFKGTRV